MQQQPLAGITVLDFGQIYNGPYCGYLLAMSGARVIKVESREGESLRDRALRGTPAQAGKSGGSATYAFAMLNANKQGVTLNLKSSEGCRLLKSLVPSVDVLVENFSPGTMDRHGVGSAELRAINPRLVYAAGTGFGATGPHRDFVAMDITVQAMTAVMSITGEGDAPLKAGPALCDFLGGVHLYGAIVAALYARERTGEGATVDVSMQDATFPTLASALGAYHFLGRPPSRVGNRHQALTVAPYNVYRALDGHVAIICIREGHWQSLVTAMGRPELATDPRFANMHARATNMALVDGIVESWTSTLSKAEVFRIAQAHDIVCAPVNEIPEVLEDEHLHARGMLHRVAHPQLGDTVLPSTPLRFLGIAPPKPTPAPMLGADNRSVYAELAHLTDAEIDALERAGAI